MSGTSKSTWTAHVQWEMRGRAIWHSCVPVLRGPGTHTDLCWALRKVVSAAWGQHPTVQKGSYLFYLNSYFVWISANINMALVSKILTVSHSSQLQEIKFLPSCSAISSTYLSALNEDKLIPGFNFCRVHRKLICTLFKSFPIFLKIQHGENWL